MLILLAGQLVNALTGPLAAILVLSGHQMKAVKILVCKAILNFSGNFLLIPMIGITGAAIAAAATITFTNLALFYYVYRLLGLNPSVFPLPARR
jgi:O-antigen/teichoic acid export membrane protein